MVGDGHDSDQSISEEDLLGLQSSHNYSFFLSSSLENKERSIQVLSQLDILGKDAYKLGANISNQKIQRGLIVEDEIEFPAFGNEDDSIDYPRVASVLDSDEDIDRLHGPTSICKSDEEIISDEEKSTHCSFGSEKVDREANTWSEVNREVEALVCTNENTGSCLPVGSSKLNKSSKAGGQRKVKPNLLFRFRSREKALPVVVTVANEIGKQLQDHSPTKELHANGNRHTQRSKPVALRALDGRGAEKQEQNILPLEGASHDYNKHSATELLECLQEKSGQAHGNSKNHYILKRRRTKAVVNRNISALGDRSIDTLLDVGSSSEDEDVLLNSKSVLQQRTMADQVLEAFGAVSQKDLMPEFIFHKESCIGLFEKLQNVMSIEKERDTDFLNKSQMGGRGFFDVRILTRSFEAKLNVCCCALIGDEENPHLLNYLQMRNQTGERMLNIIFSSRMCGDVEMEVGNLIRIHSPWKEVNIKGKEEMIILSAYFSQM